MSDEKYDSHDDEAPRFWRVRGRYSTRGQTGEWEYAIEGRLRNYDDVLNVLDGILFDVRADVHKISANSKMRVTLAGEIGQYWSTKFLPYADVNTQTITDAATGV